MQNPDFLIENNVLKKYNGSGGNVVIPDGVTRIGNDAFRNCTDLTSITIPDSVISVGEYSFNGCKSITSIIIPDGVTSIKKATFKGCSGLRSITLPDSITSIGNFAFENCCGLVNITIPNKVTNIGLFAFSGCTGLARITIPDSVTIIGDNAFNGVANVVYNSMTGKNINVIDDFKIENGVLKEYTGAGGNVVIPEGVTRIGDNAFRGCTGLTSVTIPDSVTSISNNAFYNCTGLTSVTIPDSVTSIEPAAFSHCTGLTSVTIPDNVKIIGWGSFEDCTGLTSVTIPDSVTSIGNDAFSNVPNIVYRGTASGSPWGAKSLNGYLEYPLVYADASKTNLLACSSLYQGEITIPDSVTSIGNYAFRGCTGLTSAMIGSGVTSIGWRSFEGCTGLTSVTLPDSVTNIDEYAFEGCAGLKAVHITSVESWCAINFNYFMVHTSNPLYYAHRLYLNGTLVTDLVIPDSVTSIHAIAFSGCSSLISVTLPDSVESIGNNAFKDCTGLTSVTIGSGVTSIGWSSFEGCMGLTSVTIPESVTSISQSAFEGCRSLTSIIVSEKNHIFDSRDNCNAIIKTDINELMIGCKKTNIPNSVTSIGDSAFKGCMGLENITFPDSVKYIKDYAFAGCYCTINISQSVVDISNNAFNEYRGKRPRVNFSSLEHVNSLRFFSLENVDLYINGVKDVLVNSDNISKINIDRFKRSNINILVDANVFKTHDKISPNLAPYLKYDAEAIAYVCLFQSGKTWENAVSERVSAENANEIIVKCVEIIKESKRLSPKQSARVSAIAVDYNKNIDNDVLKSLADALAAKKQSNEDLDRIVKKLNNSDKPANQSQNDSEYERIEEMAEYYLSHTDEFKQAKAFVKQGIHLKDSEKRCTKTLFTALAAEYIRIWNKESSDTHGNYSTVQVLNSISPDCISATAEKIASFLDADELIDFLKSNVDGKYYRYFIIPFAKYASEKDINWFISIIKSDKRGHAQSRYKADNSETALMLSNTKAAVLYFDQRGTLYEYARMRGTDAENLKFKYIYSFDLDENGRKKYDLGNKTVVLMVNNDLSLSLFDTKSGKIVKSIPKKGSDPEKYEKAKADFADKKAGIKKVSASITDRLLSEFLSKKTYKAIEWRELYYSNVVLNILAKQIVWTQKKKTFVITSAGLIDVNGNPYQLLDERIGVAHPLEMDADEILKWQKYFTENHLKQPFDQIWEPVIDLNTFSLKSFVGCEIPLSVLNGQEKHGIILDKESGYNHRTGNYEYIWINIRLRDCRFEWKLTTGTIEDVTMQSTITVKSFDCDKLTRQTNHIIVFLKKCTILGRIANDDKTIVDSIEGYTLAQIDSFLEFAIEKNATQCTAALLNYKNDHFGEFNEIDEFSLDFLEESIENSESSENTESEENTQEKQPAQRIQKPEIVTQKSIRSHERKTISFSSDSDPKEELQQYIDQLNKVFDKDNIPSKYADFRSAYPDFCCVRVKSLMLSVYGKTLADWLESNGYFAKKTEQQKLDELTEALKTHFENVETLPTSVSGFEFSAKEIKGTSSYALSRLVERVTGKQLDVWLIENGFMQSKESQKAAKEEEKKKIAAEKAEAAQAKKKAELDSLLSVEKLDEDILSDNEKNTLKNVLNKMEQFYPEHRYYAMDSLCSTVRENANKISKAIGYNKVTEFFAAYGYLPVSGADVYEMRKDLGYNIPGNEPQLVRGRVENTINSLNNYYPDKVIENALQREHSSLADTVTGLYQWLGYESSTAFLKAYGFDYQAEDKAGRPSSVDPQAAIAKLKELYPEGVRMSLGELKIAVPDIPWQSLQNKAKEYFGMPFGKYLVQEGIILK